MEIRVGVLVFLALAGSLIVAGQVKKSEPPPAKIPFSDSRQVVVVTTDNWSNIRGTAQLFERRNKRSEWKMVGESFLVVVGRNGLAADPSNRRQATDELIPIKKEGDGKSPSGRFPLTFAFGTASRSKNIYLDYIRLGEFTECVDDTNSGFYNKVVDRMQVGNFDWNSSEKMLAVGPQYDLGVFVGYNSYPPIKGNGSCIFLHIWKDANSGTSGCTAMEGSNLERIVGWLDRKKNPYLVQLTEEKYRGYRKSWKLPKLK